RRVAAKPVESEGERLARTAQVIGICRFSWPALGGFKTKHDTPEQRAAYLYAPARLDERFRLFEAFTLPSIRAQTDPDFTFLIVIGPDLPADRLAQLQALVADVPQAVIHAQPPGNHRAGMKEAINHHRRRGIWSLQFRHDDDDAINLRFVALLRQTFATHLPLFGDQRHGVIAFSRGWNARPDAQGIQAEPTKHLFPAVGSGMAIRPDVALSGMNFGHHDAWMHMPAIIRTEPDMWLRGINDHNDSGDALGRRLERLDAEGEARFESAFGISAARMRAIYGR
ncbi:MAG: glycosyltransferase, partial [Pararhodobacter sp.]